MFAITIFLSLFFQISSYIVTIKVNKGLMRKNGPIDFAQSLAIHMKTSNDILAKKKWGGRFAFLGPYDACKRAFLSHVVSMQRYREKEADLMLS
jgi:hypothetical protein